MEGFNLITDPETNMPIDTKTSHGKQIIKNYLNAIKYGVDSDKIVSTKMFYKQKNNSTKLKSANSNVTLKKDSPDEKNINLTDNEKPTTESQSNTLVGGSVRGTCPYCNKSVFSTQQRIKSGGKYYHETCYNCLD